MDLALFDFDHTLTKTDTFSAFLRFAVPKKRMVVGRTLLAPVIAAYKTRLLSASKARQAAVWVAFKGVEASALDQIGLNFANEQLPGMLLPMAMQKLTWHKQRGDKVVVVSASLNVYLQHWCAEQGIELLCSELQSHQGKLSGRYQDCTGRTKATRVREQYNLNHYDTVYAYGDSAEDREMLNLADHKYYNWREIH